MRGKSVKRKCQKYRITYISDMPIVPRHCDLCYMHYVDFSAGGDEPATLCGLTGKGIPNDCNFDIGWNKCPVIQCKMAKGKIKVPDKYASKRRKGRIGKKDITKKQKERLNQNVKCKMRFWMPPPKSAAQ